MPSRFHKFADLLAAVAGRLFNQPKRKRRQSAERPIRCWFERLEAREVFNVSYNGGALIPHVEAQAVFLGSQWTGSATLEAESAAIDNMLAYTVQSPFMDLLTDAGYNVGQGTAATGARISVGITGTITDANIRSLLQQAITLKLVQQPDANRLYLVYTPPGVAVNDNGATSQTTFLGYHGAFGGTDANGARFDIHYVVVPHPGTPNPVSTSQGFTGAAEVQTLTLSGGAATGSLTPAFNGAFATTSIFRSSEVQTLKFTGTGPDTVHLAFNGVSGSDATELAFVAGTSPTAPEVQAHLATIPALNGNVQVTGDAGGPFTITFIGALSNIDSTTITASAAGSSAPTVTAVTNGALPTAAQVLNSLNSIAALTGNVTVTGSAGGPFTITIKNLGNPPPIDVTGVTGGMIASITTNTNGVAGLTSDLDEMTSVTSHELAEAVTDPDVNYKTLGWYDLTNNVEIGDLTGSVADVVNQNVRLGPSGFYYQDLFSKTDKITAPDTTSIPLVTTRQDATTTDALANVTISQLSPTQVNVSWAKVDAGATGYRVLLVNGSQASLLARVPGSASSVVVSGLPSLTPVTLKIEAYNAVHTTDIITRTVTLGLPAVQAPVVSVAQAPMTPTSVNISWISPAQLLTLSGDSGGSFLLSYNGIPATAPLTRTDEVQVFTVSGSDGDKIQLSLDGVSGSVDTQLKIQAGVSPTAAEVQAHLSTIPALSSTGNAVVTGPVGGPFTITFGGGLSGVNVTQLQSSLASTTVTTTVQGAAPTAAEVATNLKTITALNGHVSVTGNPGGPYTVALSFPDSSKYVPLSVSNLTGGVIGATNPINGATGFRVFSVMGGKKTLVATLPGSATTATINGLPKNKQVSFIVEAFRGSAKVDSAAVSIKPAALTKPAGVHVNQIPGSTALLITWDPATSAKGYRIYRLTSTGRKVLLGSVGANTTSLKVSGLPKGTKFIVEAFNGPQVADSITVS